MPCTSIVIDSITGKMRLKFLTLPHENGTEVDVQMCDENFIPSTRIALFVDPRSVEHYNRDLRKESSAKGQYVKEESTDPDWNVDHVPDEEVEDETGPGDQCAL